MFIDKIGVIAISQMFDDAHPFSDGLAAVKIGPKCGFIDKSGAVVINPQFYSAFSPFRQGRAKILMGEPVDLFTVDKLGYIRRDPTCDLVPYSPSNAATRAEFSYLREQQESGV